MQSPQNSPRTTSPRTQASNNTKNTSIGTHRRDPFAEFTSETLEELRPVPPEALTTTEYKNLVQHHMTTMTIKEEEEEKIKHEHFLQSSDQHAHDPRVVYLRECRNAGLPPQPLLDYHRMSKSKFRFFEMEQEDPTSLR